MCRSQAQDETRCAVHTRLACPPDIGDVSCETAADISHADYDTPVTAVKPGWALWFCATDDLYWDGNDPACWFCGQYGRAAPEPRFNSQHGFDPDLVA